MKVLHLFAHGLGDTIMFSAVLRHIRHHNPDWQNIVIAARGRHSALEGFATTVSDDDDVISAIQHGSYAHAQTRPGLLSPLASKLAAKLKLTWDVAYEHAFPECPVTYADAPSTKTVWCLREVFDLPIIDELLQYQIVINPEHREKVDAYVNTLPGPFAVIHAQGTSCRQNKDISPSELRQMCEFLVARKITPVLLDWTLRHPLADGKRIFHPGRDHELWGAAGTGDAQVIAALMERAAVTICIDSGPGKIALAVQGTPTLQVWRHMHPIHYCDYAPHALHLVPTTHVHNIRGTDKSIGMDFFNAHYRHAVYQDADLGRLAGMFAWRMANRIPIDSKEGGDGIPVLGPKSPVYGRSPVRTLTEGVKEGFVVGIPTLNRPQLLDRCLTSIQESTVKPTRIIIINNGQYLNQWLRFRDPEVEAVTPQHNLGVAVSWNLIHKLAAPLPTIILNDDVEVAPDTFDRMLAVDSPLVTACGWSAFLQREDCWKTVGDYDETYFAYHEDDDYRWRMGLLGLQPTAIEAGIKHEPSQTRKRFTQAEDVAFMMRWQQGHERYQRKWGGLPGKETFTVPFDGRVTM